ncbi:hypothetical protein [Sutterella wadsworthensis]|uniref:hypothetical protein n=1 Tax=Sutterella wadsworthensis TaxID=40545 RepID=UPI003AF7C9D6
MLLAGSWKRLYNRREESGLLVPRVEYAERFADDLAAVTSPKVENRILENLDNIERFGGVGSSLVPRSIKEEFGGDVRKVAVNPFDLVCAWCSERFWQLSTGFCFETGADGVAARRRENPFRIRPGHVVVVGRGAGRPVRMATESRRFLPGFRDPATLATCEAAG